VQEPRKRKAGSADTLRADDDFKDGSVGRLLKYTPSHNHEEPLPKRSDDSTPEDESAFLRASQQGWRPSEKMQKHKQHFGGLAKSTSKMSNEERLSVDEMREQHLVYEKNPLMKKKRKKAKSGSESDFAAAAAAPPLLFGASLGSSKDDTVPRKAIKEHDGLVDEGLVRASVKGHHLDPAR